MTCGSAEMLCSKCGTDHSGDQTAREFPQREGLTVCDQVRKPDDPTAYGTKQTVDRCREQILRKAACPCLRHRRHLRCHRRPLWFDGQELIIQSVSLVLSKISKVFQPSLLCPIVSPLGSVQILRREV